MRCECGEALEYGRCSSHGVPRFIKVEANHTSSPVKSQELVDHEEWWEHAGPDTSTHPGPYPNFGCVIPGVDDSPAAQPQTSPPTPAAGDCGFCGGTIGYEGMCEWCEKYFPERDVAKVRIAELEAELAKMTAERDHLAGWRQGAEEAADVMRRELAQAQAERDQAAEGAQKHLFDAVKWEQELAHWRERAETAEAELAKERRLTASALDWVKELEAKVATLAAIGFVQSKEAEWDAALTTLPAAAERLLAAQRVAELYRPDAWHQNADLLKAYDAWRKAGQA